MKVITINNNLDYQNRIFAHELFDKHTLKNDLMTAYSKSEFEADIWIFYNYKIFQKLVNEDILKNEYDNEVYAYETYEKILEFLLYK